MGLKRRVRKLEEKQGPERCPGCGDQIIIEEHHPDGSISYPFGEPCAHCGSVGRPDGLVRCIVVCAPPPCAVCDCSPGEDLIVLESG